MGRLDRDTSNGILAGHLQDIEAPGGWLSIVSRHGANRRQRISKRSRWDTGEKVAAGKGDDGGGGGSSSSGGHRGVVGLWGTREHLSVNGFCNWESVKLPNHPVHLLALLDELIRRIPTPRHLSPPLPPPLQLSSHRPVPRHFPPLYNRLPYRRFLPNYFAAVVAGWTDWPVFCRP